MPHRLIGIVAPLLLLALSACSDQPKPKTAPEPEATTSAGPPSSSAPPAPSLGAVATVRAWVEAQNRALDNGDTTTVRALSTEPCRACEGLIRPIEDVYAAGGRFETPGWLIDHAKIDRSKSKVDEAIVNTAITISGGRTLNATGEKPVSYGAEKRIIVFKLARRESSWLVSFVGFL